MCAIANDIWGVIINLNVSAAPPTKNVQDRSSLRVYVYNRQNDYPCQQYKSIAALKPIRDRKGHDKSEANN